MPPGREAPITVDAAPAIPEPERADVVSLLEASRGADGYPSLSERTRLRVWEGPDERRVLLSARLAATHELAGFSVLERGAEVWVVETAVDPEHRGLPVYRALVEAALGEVATRGGGRVGFWHRGAPDGGRAALELAGLRAERELLQLRMPLSADALAAAPMPSVAVRPFRPGHDERAWLEANRRAFAGHPEQGAWTQADLERRERAPWFDPSDFLLHEVDGRIAAFCWTKVHRDRLMGEIYVIGVDPDFQGQGLGRALTVAGLEHLAGRAVPTAMLYVESTNTKALALYGSLGMEEHHRETLYVADLPRQVATPTARPMP